MTVRLIVFLFGLLVAGTTAAQETEWGIFEPGGHSATLDDVVRAAADVKVVLVGELHDDEAGHRFQLALLEALDRGDRRLVSLSLEMFERDVQLVVDEYLAGHISEAHFRASARPWPNYERDYRPLVEYAKAAGLPVVAANVPRRYVNLVARGGIGALDSLFGQARVMLPRLPLPEASQRYRETFMSRTSGMHGHGGPPPENMFQAQHLWDAGMAEAIVREMERDENRLVVHLAGSFHVDEDTGIPDMIRAIRPGTTMLSIVIRPATNFDADAHGTLGDFVVITPEVSPEE
jgi:uncharacterized iron-regulated protein